MIFRWIIPVLKWFRSKIMNNPTLIDENHLGMASENTNFQAEFSKRICFFSSSFLSLSFYLFWFLEVRFPSISGLLWFQNQNKSLHKSKNELMICLKKLNSLTCMEVLSEIEANESWNSVNKKYLFLRQQI